MTDLTSRIAVLARRLELLTEDYESLRGEGNIANVQFLSAGGYLRKAEIHLNNAAEDYRKGLDP